ncbi:MAG TPA: M20/M25/M40 family metallo-hydrolase [Blastocatellia bacterium]|nr:M20/M25/M40 family metallo-hydrolase [Blastocatellia bacterium]
MRDTTIEFLRDLIAIDSVNPLLVPGSVGEVQIAGRLAAEMRQIGLDVEISESAPGRPNVVGVLEGQCPGPVLMFCGHLDTVGVTGMKAPFDPVERDGRIHGRGAQDMKGGVAAMIGAARQLATSGGLARGRLILAGVADEEYTSIGAEALVKKWKADAAVVTEPTDLIIAVGHKGFTWVEVTVRGRAAHGSRPADGRDAILRMGRVLARLESLDCELRARAPHPVLGTGSLHASFVEGGRELSTYPDRCVLKMERRTVTGEAPDAALREVELIIELLKDQDPEFDAEARLLFDRRPYETPVDHPLPGMLESVLAGLGRASIRSGMSFWTDAAILGYADIPSLIFGPGGAGLHSVEEYVLVDEVLGCRDALAEIARRFTS